MFYLSPEGDRYYLGRAFKYGELQYSPAAATHAKFTELGFTQVVVEPTPDPRFYTYSGPDNSGKYNSTPRNLKDTQLSFVDKQLQTAHKNLAGTDWILIRANETPQSAEVGVPSAVLTERSETRAVCDTNCGLILATKDIPELEALIKSPAEVLKDPNARKPMYIPNPDPHLERYPSFDLAKHITRELLVAQLKGGSN